MSDALVDVFCNDLEVGRSLVLQEVGPTSAYLVHPTPMPVGAELRVQTDSGSELGAVVVRVNEQSNPSREPGMFVRVVQIEGDAEKWWKSKVAIDADPVFPQPPLEPRPPVALVARTNTLDVSDEEMAQMAAEDRGDAPTNNQPPTPSPSELAAEDSRPRDVATTARMSVEELKEITDKADDDASKNGVSTSNGKPSDKKKRRKRRKKD